MNTRIESFILNENLDEIANKIKFFFSNKGHVAIIKNTHLYNDDIIINTYNDLNSKIGKLIPIDLVKDTYEQSGNYWADVKYDYGSDEKQFWRSSNHQNLHTDNTFADKDHYANLTELVCFKPSEYSGHTVVISNNKIVELIKFCDKHRGTNLYNKILNKEIFHSAGRDLYLKNKILTYDEKNNQYLFCFNYYPASRGNNTEEDMEIITELHNFLEEKIMISSDLMDEIKLNKGDALIFNDELIMHGRKSFIGTRYYKKTGILLDEACFNNKMNFNLEPQNKN